MDCCQLALSTMDLARTHWWYRRALGFLPAGERRRRGGPEFAAVPGLPEVALDVWCLVSRQTFVQIEMIEFAKPRMRPRPPTWQRSDIGYTTVGIHVPDFEAAVARIERVGGRFVTAPVGRLGDRRVCLHDPDDTLLELMEQHPVGGRPTADGDALPAIGFVSLSVRDIDRSLRLWVDALGCTILARHAVHQEEHESLWGLAGAVRETAVVAAGDVAIELVCYRQPAGRSRPAGSLLSDQGILNVALGSTNKDEFDEVYARARDHGFYAETEPWTVPGVATVVYVWDGQGLTVELLHVEPDALERMGFVANVAAMHPSERAGVAAAGREAVDVGGRR